MRIGHDAKINFDDKVLWVRHWNETPEGESLGNQNDQLTKVYRVTGCNGGHMMKNYLRPTVNRERHLARFDLHHLGIYGFRNISGIEDGMFVITESGMQALSACRFQDDILTRLKSSDFNSGILVDNGVIEVKIPRHDIIIDGVELSEAEAGLVSEIINPWFVFDGDRIEITVTDGEKTDNARVNSLKRQMAEIKIEKIIRRERKSK